MEDHILVKTQNILKAHEALDYLLSRPVAHQAGLSLLFGAPGLGKTQFSQRTAITQNYVWFSAKKADTPKGFIQELTKLLLKRYYPQNIPYVSGSKSTLFYRCLDILNENTTREHMPMIFIDEVDNIIHEAHESIIGMLRDIVDNSAAAVVLIGMQELRTKLMKLNAHYYKRVAYFCEFTPLTDSDVVLLCNELSDIVIAPDLIKHTAGLAKGDARNVIKALRHYEELAMANNVTSMDMGTFTKLVRGSVTVPKKNSIPFDNIKQTFKGTMQAVGAV